MVKHGVLLVTASDGMQMLTNGLPSALLPLLDEPLAGLALHLLRRHGVKQVTVVSEDENVRSALGDGSLYRLNIRYAPAWPEDIDEPVFLLRGDVLTDVDLSELARRLAQAGKDAAMAMGAAAVSARGLGCIPAGTKAEHVFAVLSEACRDILAADLAGYWCAVNDPDDYRRAQLDLLEGRVGMPVRGRRLGHAIVAEGSSISEDVRVTGRCYVGRFARIGPGSVLGAGTVVGRGAQIGRKAYLENTCLMENSCIDSDAVLRNVLVIPRHGNQLLQHLLPFSAKES